MIRILVINLVLLGSIVLQVGAASISSNACQLGTCSCVGDPHLIPFPTAYGQTQSEYWCQQSGWRLLLENPYVVIYIFVGPSPYLILDYVVIFPGAPACVLIGDLSGAQTCSAGTPATSTVIVAGQSWSHVRSAQSIIVDIDQYPDGSIYYYDIYVTQPFYLRDQSKGLCVKWDCPLETAYANPIPIVVGACGIVLDAIQQQPLCTFDKNLIDQAHTSCVNDLQLTYKPIFAQTIIGVVLQRCIPLLVTNDNRETLRAVVNKVAAQQQVLRATTTIQINNLIANCTRNNPDDQCLQSKPTINVT